MNAISDWEIIKNGFDFSYLLEMLNGVIPMFITFTLHELSHALVAWHFGDDTAKRAGRITLNPLKHIDPIGALMLLTVRFGYAKPVPVSMHKLRDPKHDMALVALAGPASNVLITVVFMFLYGALFIPLRASKTGDYILNMIQYTAYISMGQALFNMLPIPPLDGSKVLFSVLDTKSYLQVLRYERYGSLLLLALMWSNVITRPLWTAVQQIVFQLSPLSQWACHLVAKLFYS